MKRLCSFFLCWVLMLPAMFPYEAVAEETEAAAGNLTYYVSDTEGDDNNDGLSAETPWKTLEKVSELELAAGTHIYLRSGDIWYGTWEINANGGSRENPIVITSYGDGAAPSLRYYTGSVQEGAAENVMVVNDANGLEIRNLDIGYANAGIRFQYTNSYDNEYIVVENCHFHDIYGVTQADNISQLPFSASIYLSAQLDDPFDKQTGPYCVTDVTIRGCTTYDAASLTGYFGYAKDLNIIECIAENNGYYGAVITSAGGVMERSVFRNNGTRPMPVGSTALMISARDYTVRDCIFAEQQRQGNDPDGCGVDFEWDNHNVVFERCLFEKNAGVGLMFFTSGQGANGTNYDCRIVDCTFIDNNVNIGNMGGFEIYAVGYGTSGCELTGNRWLVTGETKSETVDFLFQLENNDISENGTVKLDSRPEDADPLPAAFARLRGEENTQSPGTSPTQTFSLGYAALGFGVGILFIGAVFIIVYLVSRRRQSKMAGGKKDD